MSTQVYETALRPGLEYGPDPMGVVRRADLAFLRYHGLTEWLVCQAIDLQPQPCTVESLPTLATISTAVTSELASLTGLGLTSFFLHQHVGRVYAIGVQIYVSEDMCGHKRSRIVHPPLPWLVGVPASCRDVVVWQRGLAANIGTMITYRGGWPGSATPAAVRDLLLQGLALGLTRPELAYWLLLLQMLEAHYARPIGSCGCTAIAAPA